MKRTNLALVKTRAATVQVQARPVGKDSHGNVVLSQASIDRIPDGHVPMYQAQRMGHVVGSENQPPRFRPWLERLRSRLGWIKSEKIEGPRRF